MQECDVHLLEPLCCCDAVHCRIHSVAAPLLDLWKLLAKLPAQLSRVYVCTIMRLLSILETRPLHYNYGTNFQFVWNIHVLPQPTSHT